MDQALIAAARQHYQAGHRAEAAAAYRQLLDHTPDHPEALLLLGLILADCGDATLAEDLLRRAVAVSPGNAMAWHSLAMLLQTRGDDSGAVPLFETAVALQPGFAPAANDLGASLHRLGRRAQALAAFERAIAADPDFVGPRFNRATALAEMKRRDEAVAGFQDVLARDPSSREAWYSLGVTLTDLGRLDLAERACRQAIALDPAYDDATTQLAQVLERAHRGDEAAQVLLEHGRRLGVVVRPSTGEGKRRVLIIAGAASCNVRASYLFDAARYSTVAIHLPPSDPDAAAALAATLPPCDIAFNAIANMDRAGPFLETAEALIGRLGCPVLNPPAKVARTRRDSTPLELAGIPGLEVPATRRVGRDELAALDIPVGVPVLVRPTGSHGGEDLVRVGDRAEMAALLAALPHPEFYLTPYVDYRSPDGMYRKYRLIFVDRRVFPYHLAVNQDWLVHYFRADMEHQAALRQEEEAFLEDWRSVFPGRLGEAVEEVARRLDLDYAGIDCSITADGTVLLFEANASMLVHLHDPTETFAYKYRAVPRIFAALDRMVESHLLPDRMVESHLLPDRMVESRLLP